MRFTSKHYFNFGKKLNKKNILINEDGWDSVRCDDNNTPFAIPKELQDFVDKASRSYIKESQDLVDLIAEKGFKEVYSVGCGCGYLEYQMKEMKPELKITATDFNPKSIERLKNVFKTCDRIEEFNMMTGDYSAADGLLYLFFRIDTEVSNEEWLEVYKKMHNQQAQYVLVAATEFLTFERFAKETIKGMLKIFRGYTFCGYIRTKESFEALWGDYYKIERQMRVGALNAYLLRINEDKK